MSNSTAKADRLSTVRITEIFYSLQGETDRSGLPTIFIRLTGCPLRCSYCDSAYAFTGGTLMSISEILQDIGQYKTPWVTVTGGEPLAQKSCLPLLTQLADAGYSVSLETSGALDLSEVDLRVVKVMDIKTPSSAEVSKNRYENLPLLSPQDRIKLVICDRADYDWAVSKLAEHKLDSLCEVLFSPSSEQQSAQQLADWILQDQLPVRFQIQLHKYLWGDGPGR